MTRTTILLSGLILVLLVGAVYTSVIMIRDPIVANAPAITNSIPPTSQVPVSSAPVPVGIPPQTNSEGNVEIVVQPKSIRSDSPTWNFDVSLETHSVELSQDLVQVSELANETGTAFKPIAWEGDPPGGHHRKGTLIFKPITPMPKTLKLTIRTIGEIPTRTFQWFRQ